MISHEAEWQEFVATRVPALREQLVLQYAPLVKYVIHTMSMIVPPLATMEDMVGYGTIGLLHAVDRYSPDRGVTFETYAISRIRGAIIDAIRSMNLFSRSDTARIKAVDETVQVLVQELRRYPTEDEIAERMGIERQEVDRTLATSNVSLVSLDNTTGGDYAGDGATLKDMLEDTASPEPGEVAEQKELRALLVEAINHLPERSRLVISLYYVEELSPIEIAEVLEVSRSRVYQLHAQAILDLRAWMRSRMNGQRPARMAIGGRA